ncbi:MAG: FecR domain-containing protein [Bryobacteraceae bacterium]
MSNRWIVCWALTPLLGLPCFAQSVISAHSGLIHFSDGSVFLDDQRVEQKTGKFDQMNNGSELRTEEGRAEVLLTPGTFLRVGANSAVRMLSNKLEDTRVELLRGSAVLDQASDTLADTSVTILYNLDQVRIKQPGRYRFDSEPPQVKVEKGDAEVTADGKTVEATAGYVVAFEGKLTARKLLDDPSPVNRDSLDNWSEARNNSVDQSNQDAAATSDLSGVIDGWNNNPDAVLQSLGIPPYIPGMSSMVPPPGYGLSPYGGLYGSYGSGLYGSGLYGSPLYYSALYPYGLYGPGLVNPLLVYGLPTYRRSYYPSYGYRGLTPTRTGYGYTPGRSVITGRGASSVGIGVGRPVGGVRVGGGHR